jgi:polysaccharide pyruvyl transferase WcaK-like protein
MSGVSRSARKAGRPLRIGVFGQLGSGNWGNDASLDVILSALEATDDVLDIGFMSMGTPEAAARHGWAVVPLQWYEGYAHLLPWLSGRPRQLLGRALDVVRTLRWPRRCDLVIVPGAGVLEDTTPVRPWSMPLSLLFLGLGARLARSRLAYVGIGASVPPSRATRRVFSWAARCANYLSCRDDLSRRALVELGVPPGRVSVFSDLAFALDVPDVPLPCDEDRPLVAVGVMNFRGRAEDRDRAEELHQIYRRGVEDFLERVLDEGWQVVLVTGDREDVAVAHAVLRSVETERPDSVRWVRAAAVDSMESLLEVLACAQCVVASRYHNVLGALILGRPTVSLSYASKNDDLMERMGLHGLTQPIDAVDPHLLVEQFHRLAAERKELHEIIIRHRAYERARVQQQLVELSALVRSRVRDRRPG